MLILKLEEARQTKNKSHTTSGTIIGAQTMANFENNVAQIPKSFQRFVTTWENKPQESVYFQQWQTWT